MDFTPHLSTCLSFLYGFSYKLTFLFLFSFPSTQKNEVAQLCPAFCDPMDCIAHQVFLSIGCSREEYWNELPFPSLGDLPTQGLNSGLPHCRQTLYHLSHRGSHPLLISILNSSKTLVSTWALHSVYTVGIPHGLCGQSMCFPQYWVWLHLLSHWFRLNSED